MRGERFKDYVQSMLRAWTHARDARTIADLDTPEFRAASTAVHATEDEILRLTGLMPDEVDFYDPKPRRK